jgi:ABC-type transporter Mla subunit MlaD
MNEDYTYQIITLKAWLDTLSEFAEKNDDFNDLLGNLNIFTRSIDEISADLREYIQNGELPNGIK